MKVLITGGLGFVGTQLSIRLLERRHRVTVVDHSPEPREYTPPEVHYVSADTTVQGPWQKKVATQDVVINLAGASIFNRWSDETKKLIYDSRILTTRNVVEAMPAKEGTLLCSTSAVGYYGFRGNEEISEGGAPGDDFLSSLCVDWENEANKAVDKGVRVAVNRRGFGADDPGVQEICRWAIGQRQPVVLMDPYGRLVERFPVCL